jgi:DNA-binding CsgD family transcriptional regulator
MINSGSGKNLADVTKHIETEFSRWTLSDTEKDIAWLILKGVSFLEIAEMRNRSERTIRQQAGAIYAKSGLRSRAELSAFFLEDLFDS